MDKFSLETQLVNKLRFFLVNNNFTIAQLVSPGGQCHISLSFTDIELGRKRIIFPDLVCFSANEILIGEVKPKFSTIDKKKLLSLKTSSDAEINIRKTLSRKWGNLNSLSISYVLIHGDMFAKADDTFSQMIIAEDSVRILPIKA